MTDGTPSRDLIVSSFRLHKNGLTPLGKPTYTEWVACGTFIQEAEKSVQFWIGDWLLFGEKTYGKVQYEQAIQQTGLDYSTLRFVSDTLPVTLFLLSAA